MTCMSCACRRARHAQCCGTGLSVVVGGDEQLGLVRGYCMRARGRCCSRSGPYDSSTALHEAFYARLQELEQGASGTRGMRELREHYPHPFYWHPLPSRKREAP